MQLEARGLPIHTRTLSVTLSADDDGAVAFDAYVLDLRKRGFVPVAGDLQGTGIIHHMLLAGTLDPLARTITHIGARMPTVAFEASAASEGESCRDLAFRVGHLDGTPIDGSWARTLGAEDLWIDAMANAKSGKLVDVASRAMNDECGFVRSAALRALGGVSDERALQALIRASRDDVDPAARSTALAQLATRSDAAAHEAILVAAETDSDAQVRDAALTALARGGVAAADRNRLEAIARNDAVEGLREFATRLLRGR